MPLKRKKEAEEAKKNQEQGGDKLNPEEIRSIVEQVLAEREEKGKTTQDLGVIRSEVGELKGQLAQVQKALYCTKDGKFCFNSPEELTAFMQSQKEKMDGLDSKISEIVSQVKGIGEAGNKQTLPGGVQRLPELTAELRAGMSEQDNETRDLEVKAIADYFRVSDNDGWRRIEKNPVNLDVIAKKKNMRKKVFDGITDQELKDVTLMACKDGKCKPFREGLEKEAGIKFYAKDERGKFRPVDQPKPEPSYI